MKYKKCLALAVALGLVLAVLAGCQPEGEEESVAVSSGPQVTLENTGEGASLTVAYQGLSDDYAGALEEIVEKYRADFPGTEIALAPCGSQEEMLGLLRAGKADLAQVEGDQVASWVDQGLLWDFYPYLQVWKEEPGLGVGIRQAAGLMGSGKAYVLPADLRQEVLFYRADWVDGYNEGQEDADRARIKTWGQLCEAREKLGDKGRLAMGAKGRLGTYFDGILWSRAGQGMMVHPSAAYFMKDAEEEDEITTLFQDEAGKDAATRFQIVMEDLALPGCEGWTVGEAVEAFKKGEAGFLLAESSYYGELAGALPEEALGVAGFPRTDNGLCIGGLDFWGWGIGEKSGQREVAVHFLTYLSNADNSTHMAKTAGTLPLHRDGLLMEPSLLEGDRAAEMDMLKQSTEYQYASRPTMYLEAMEVFPGEYEELLGDFLAGDLGKKELLSALDSFWMEAYDSQPNTWAPKPKKEDEE